MIHDPYLNEVAAQPLARTNGKKNLQMFSQITKDSANSLQLVLMQVAAATASGEGFAAAHAERHLSSPQGHFRAQSSAAAQVESAKQSLI